MERRTFIRHAMLAGTASVFPGCRRAGAKEEVLRALVERVVVPNTADVAKTSRRLAVDLARLVAEPSLASLRASREQWQRALSSWKRADVFRSGPIMDTNCLLRAMFWPVRTGAIDALLQGSASIDDASIDAMGVDRRGLFALEYLLYPAQAEDRILAGFVGPGGERRARFASALASNVSLHADQAARSLGDGKEYARKFAERGQDSLSLVVGQLVHTVENVSATRLARISSLAKRGLLQATEVEGGVARVSQEIALTYLRGAEQLYLGVDHGLRQLVSALSGAVDDQIRSTFSQAIAAVSNLGLPLEEVAKQDPGALDAAAGVVKKLERGLKTDLASTLGVTMTFSSLDGD